MVVMPCRQSAVRLVQVASEVEQSDKVYTASVRFHDSSCISFASAQVLRRLGRHRLRWQDRQLRLAGQQQLPFLRVFGV